MYWLMPPKMTSLTWRLLFLRESIYWSLISERMTSR